MENISLTSKQDKKYRILICGGAGYVGGHLTDLLVKNGQDVTIYDNLTYEDRFMKNVSFIFGDVRDHAKLSNFINDFDIVIWLAALVGDGACAINPTLTKEINVDSVEWLVQNYRGKIIFMSTSSVYGVNNELLDESSPTNALSLYASTKLEAEKKIINRAGDYLAFRLGTLFGIGDRDSRLRFDLVVNSLAQKAFLREPLSVYGGGQWRPLLHVKDVAEAIVFGIQKKISGLYNLSNENYRICDIVEKIKTVLPIDIRIEYTNQKFEDLRNYKVTSSKFKAYGWRPQYDLEFGIREIYTVLEENRIKNPKDIVHSNVDFLKNKIV